MKINISNIIEIKEPTQEILDYCKNELTFSNPDYIKKQRMGFFVGRTPKKFTLYDNYQGNIYVPVGCFENIWKIHPIASDYKDYTSVVPRDITSNMVMREYQEPCMNALKKYVNGIFLIIAGGGKTNIALECAARLKQHTCFIVHTKELLNQAKERCESTLNCTTSVISDGKCDVSGDIVFATVQTLVNLVEKQEIKQNEFGLLVCDECFPKGTKISTPHGYMNIEDIKIGDVVFSYNHDKKIIEEKRVNYLFKKECNKLINIKLSNNEYILCTYNHPIYTDRGYIRADELKKGDVVYEMQSMWERDNQRRLRKKSVATKNGLFQKTWYNLLFNKMWKNSQYKNFKKLYDEWGWLKKNERKQSNVETRSETEISKNIKRNGSQISDSWWKWNRYDCASSKFKKSIGKRKLYSRRRICSENKNESWFRLSNMLQNRFGDSGKINRNRSGWSESQFIGKTSARCEERYFLGELRVENVKVQKQGSFRKRKSSSEKNYVYNIGVDDNHNYFANDILVHNCHHVSTNAENVKMFEKCINYFTARYKLGMTATLHRSDQMEKTTTKILGDVIYELRKEKDKLVGYYENEPILSVPLEKFQTQCKVFISKTQYKPTDECFDNTGRIRYTSLISSLATDLDRNKQILNTAKNLLGYTIIVSERVTQLEYLEKNLDYAVRIDSKMKKKDREQVVNDFRSGKYKYLLATYSLIAEGFDVPMLENIVMASPVKDERLVIQSVGRCQRPYNDKKYANVYDFYDDVGILYKAYRNRIKIYKKEEWEIINN